MRAFIIAVLMYSVHSAAAQVTIGSANIEYWFDGAGAYYSAYHNGHWYVLIRSYGRDPVRVCEISLTDVNTITVSRVIPLDVRTAIFGFIINAAGEFVATDSRLVRTFSTTGTTLGSFEVNVGADYYSSPIATDNQNRVYVVRDDNLAVYTREGTLLRRIKTGWWASSVAVAPDGKIWVITCYGGSCHLECYSAYPECVEIADYDRWSHPIVGIDAAGPNNDNYLDWRELAVTKDWVLVTHGYGRDIEQSIYVLNSNGDTLITSITSTVDRWPRTLTSVHGISAFSDTLIYFGRDSKQEKWLNVVTPFADWSRETKVPSQYRQGEDSAGGQGGGVRLQDLIDVMRSTGDTPGERETMAEEERSLNADSGIAQTAIKSAVNDDRGGDTQGLDVLHPEVSATMDGRDKDRSAVHAPVTVPKQDGGVDSIVVTLTKAPCQCSDCPKDPDCGCCTPQRSSTSLGNTLMFPRLIGGTYIAEIKKYRDGAVVDRIVTDGIKIKAGMTSGLIRLPGSKGSLSFSIDNTQSGR